MLSTQYPSKNSKTGPISTSYRAGEQNRFGTCPSNCNLCDKPGQTAKRIDHKYMQAVYDTVPNGGKSFTYSHFHHKLWAHKYPVKTGKAVINYSGDTITQALNAHKKGIPAVVALTQGQYDKARKNNIPAKICPADKEKGRNCSNCGGSKGPICSWIDRKFIVVFLVHGTGAAKAASDENGGCYAESGFYTRIAWRNLSERAQETTDAQAHVKHIKSLPFGTCHRSHIAGDFGKNTV